MNLGTVAHQAPLSMDSPGKNPGVGCDFLLHGIFVTQGFNLHLLHWQAASRTLSRLVRPLYFHQMVCLHQRKSANIIVLSDSLAPCLQTCLFLSSVFPVTGDQLPCSTLWSSFLSRHKFYSFHLKDKLLSVTCVFVAPIFPSFLGNSYQCTACYNVFY